MAVAVAGLLAAATACSFSEASEAPEVTPESLLAYLNDRDMPFVHAGYQSPMPFKDMNGFERRTSVTGEFTWEAEKLWLHQFVGPGEALVAATRIDQHGGQFMMPKRGGGWVGGGGYGIAGPVSYYLNGKVIAIHLGGDAEVPEALEELMGKPFAGTPIWDAEVDLEERITGAKDMWAKETPASEFIAAERFSESSDGVTYRIRYRANLMHSFACSGESDFLTETNDDEISITIIQRIVDTDIVTMAEPCDIKREWTETSAIVQRLTPGKTYSVFINGESVASFVVS